VAPHRFVRVQVRRISGQKVKVEPALGGLHIVFDELRFVGKRQPMAAYRFGGLENTLLQPGESGLMSMIG
jgi:hypothetical protein